jgi:hypothetical protein
MSNEESESVEYTDTGDPVFPRHGSGIPRYFEDIKPGDISGSMEHRRLNDAEAEQISRRLREKRQHVERIMAQPPELPTVSIEFPSREIPQWEYQIIDWRDLILDSNLQNTLNGLGKEGWQVSVSLGSDGLLLIREILPESDEELKERLKRQRAAEMTPEEKQDDLDQRIEQALDELQDERP